MPAPPPEQQAQPPESIALGRFDGIKNTDKRERLSPRDLAGAINVDLDDDGQLHRRRGFTKVAAGSYHSLFLANNNKIYGVKDGDIGRINLDYTFDVLRLDVGGDYSVGFSGLAYASVGPKVYFSSDTASGIIDTETDIISDWGDSQDIWLSPVVNPIQNLPDVRGKLLGAPPRARCIAYYNGRLYLANKRTLWATELWLYNYVDKTRTFFPFEDDITMVGAVSDGLYVGTEGGVYFLKGDTLAELRRIPVMDSPAIPGSMVYIPQEIANPEQVPQERDVRVSVGFMSTQGFCVAAEGGQVMNLTETRMFFPKAQRASAMFRRQDGYNQYVVSMDSGGDPRGNAAIGDYVDARIIRGRDKWVQVGEGLNISEQFSPTWR